MRKLEKALALAFFLTVLFSFTTFAGQCEDIPNHVLRLHILANSDSPSDQALKLRVRDRILKESVGMLDGAETKEEARRLIQSKLPELEAAAQEELLQYGCKESVSAQLVEDMYFTTRRYESVTLPAGQYEALRITIGEAKGKNWWCVMFPPICLPAAQGSSELSDVLSSAQLELVEGGEGEYEIKFKSVEVYEQIRQWFSEKAN